MKTAKYWLNILPHVYYVQKNGSALLYNTQNGENIHTQNIQVIDLLEEMHNKKNLGVIDIDDTTYKHSDIDAFIKESVSKNICNITEIIDGQPKPIQLMPILNLQKDVKKLNKEDGRSIGEGILHYLSDVTLYLNNTCNLDCQDCNNYMNQFFHCSKLHTTKYIDFELLKKFLKQLTFFIQRIAITGGNIFLYHHFSEFIAFCQEEKIMPSFGIHYGNIDRNKITLLNEFPIEIFVTFPLENDFIHNFDFLSKQKNTKIIFEITSEEDYQQAATLISEYAIENYDYKPFYNGRNQVFFEKNVYLTKDDIFNDIVAQRTIFCNQVLNSNFFGKLNIFSNGDVFANINMEKLGNINEHTLLQLISREMETNTIWRKIRDKEPCNNCLYQYLCPPLSNYEITLKKDNLCHETNKNTKKNKVSHKESKERGKKTRFSIMIVLILLLFASPILMKPYLFSIIPLFIAKVIGLFFTILLVRFEMGYHSTITEKLCTLKNAGCKAILNSKISKLFSNLFFSDIGLIWFIGTSLYLLFTSIINLELPSFHLLGWLSICYIPVILFSISYQLFVIKKYCPLCIGVMLMLITEVLFMFVIYDFRFQLPQLSEVLMLTTILLITTFTWVKVKQLLIKNISLQKFKINYLNLKRNPIVIQALLEESTSINTSKLPHPIRLTDNKSNILITVVLDLYCMPCKEKFIQIKDLLTNSYRNCIDVQVILFSEFEHLENIDHQITKTYLHFIALSQQQPVNHVQIALFDWFEQIDYLSWSNKYPATINETHLKQFKEQITWFYENNYDKMPVIFINDKMMPNLIDFENIISIINNNE
jgi:pseudo-rSAM protein